MADVEVAQSQQQEEDARSSTPPLPETKVWNYRANSPVEDKGELMGGLEKAASATIDAWAQNLRGTLKRARHVDWAEVMVVVEQAFEKAANVGDNFIALTPNILPAHASADLLRNHFSAGHPSLAVTLHTAWQEGTHCLRWE